ncbi:uncharacterized protein LOC143064434 [Mytilus galloprovincialis]|uniref:Fibronectin type-III domain-containing protein n=2 Tax=Mytilus galloprovincialis TaxID=29158 RepID=A0A8B6FQ03_MYTGA|nr:Hypothetical predicted protein [Mytilus galloprovincialis]
MILEILETMASTEKLPIYIDAVEVSSTSTSSVEILWRANPDTVSNVLGYRVHYQKIASSYIQYGPHLSPTIHSYTVHNLVADTYYRICLMMLRNDTATLQKCVDASTRSWHIPVSIGSSIGAVLALSMIVFVILLLRWPSSIHWRGKQKTRKYDSMSSHFNDELYDFSESVTMTAGHDDMFSDQSEGYVFELPVHNNGHCNGNTNYVIAGVHRKGSSSSSHKHSGHHHHGRGHCTHSGHSHSGIRHHSHQESSIMQDLNHNHHHHRHEHGDSIILHANDEQEQELDCYQINGMPHAHTEPILPSTEFYEFEMQDMKEVSNMPEPDVRPYLETSIDDDIA